MSRTLNELNEYSTNEPTIRGCRLGCQTFAFKLATAGVILFANDVSMAASLGAFSRDISLDLRTLALAPKSPPQFWKSSRLHAFDGENAVVLSPGKDGREVALAHARIQDNGAVAQTLFEAPPISNASSSVSVLMRGPDSAGLVREIPTGQGSVKLTQSFRVDEHFGQPVRVQELEQIESKIFDGTAKFTTANGRLEGHLVYRDNGALKGVFKIDEKISIEIGRVLRLKFSADGKEISVFALKNDQIVERIYKLELADGAPGQAGIARLKERGVVKLSAEEVEKQAFFKIERKVLAGRKDSTAGARGMQVRQADGQP